MRQERHISDAKRASRDGDAPLPSVPYDVAGQEKEIYVKFAGVTVQDETERGCVMLGDTRCGVVRKGIAVSGGAGSGGVGRAKMEGRRLSRTLRLFL